MLKKIRAIVFDIDGVITKSRDEKGQFFWSANIERDLGIKSGDLAYLFANSWDDVLLDRVDTKEKILNFLKKIDSQIDVNEFLKYWFKRDFLINPNCV